VSNPVRFAPGWPGIPARWTSSAKNGIGTAIQPTSRVWFTHSHGILNEVYFPDVDHACTRDMEILVTNGRDFFSEEKRDTRTEVILDDPGVPVFRLVNTCTRNRYRIEKTILADPSHDAVLQQIRFTPLQGSADDYHLYILLSPHLNNFGGGNTAWIGEYAATPLLYAERDGSALALGSSSGFLKRSVGFVGTSDGWQDLTRHFCMRWEYDRAENGNIAVVGELPPPAGGETLVLSLGFGSNASLAAEQALAGLRGDFHRAETALREGWQHWQRSLSTLGYSRPASAARFRTSMAVLKTSESKTHPGGIIAGLSIPWGFAKGDDDLGGYHLVWPRDLVESAGALLAGGANAEAIRVLQYLKATQCADGHWAQNMWLDGSPYWNGIQTDETGFPILLADMAYREGTLSREELAAYWPMLRKAACYLLLNGPVTQEDRWEEDPGYSPFTLAVEISAMLAASSLAELNNDAALGSYLRDTADFWNSRVDRWTYVTDTPLAHHVGVEGYYVRIAPPDVGEASSPANGYVPIKNRPPGESVEPAAQIVSPDALALVRFGVRAPDDPRILNTVKVIDALLKVETPAGPVWRRYNDDGYGEHQDGSPFDGTGIGRAWPLLTGERAHYELAAGNPKEAERLLAAFESFANAGGLYPEQVWDARDIPERELFFGRPSGSAMPLAWAHAEYVKLLRSLRDGKIYDMPAAAAARYARGTSVTPFAVWRFNLKATTMPRRQTLRVEVLAPATVHWSSDDWTTIHDTPTRDTGFGLHTAELPTRHLTPGSIIRFTFFWPGADHWEGRDFAIAVTLAG
jgi:glucoamylase